MIIRVTIGERISGRNRTSCIVPFTTAVYQSFWTKQLGSSIYGICFGSRKADSRADPILSVRFWSNRLFKRKQISFVQIENSLCEIGSGDVFARVISLFARVIQQLRRWSQKIQANVDTCYVWRREETRRVHFARHRTQVFEPALH